MMMTSTDQSKLMSAIRLSDSDDSSSDDIIPMQRRKRQRNFSKRRQLHGSAPSSVFLKSNYTYGLCTLFKFILVTLIIGTLIVSLALSYNLYARLELLQINIDGLQTTKSNLPEELHLIHSHLKWLDQNSTQTKSELARTLALATNLTSEIDQIKEQLGKITQSIEAAPAIAQLPKDVESLQKTVAGLGSRLDSDDKEVKLAREQQVNHTSRLTVIETTLKLLEGNLSTIVNYTESTSKESQTLDSLQDKFTHIETKFTELTSMIDSMNKSQQRLDQWRLAVQDKLYTTLNESNTNNMISDDGLVHSRSHHTKRVLLPLEAPVESNFTDNNNGTYPLASPTM